MTRFFANAAAICSSTQNYHAMAEGRILANEIQLQSEKRRKHRRIRRRHEMSRMRIRGRDPARHIFGIVRSRG